MTSLLQIIVLPEVLNCHIFYAIFNPVQGYISIYLLHTILLSCKLIFSHIANLMTIFQQGDATITDSSLCHFSLSDLYVLFKYDWKFVRLHPQLGSTMSQMSHFSAVHCGINTL